MIFQTGCAWKRVGASDRLYYHGCCVVLWCSIYNPLGPCLCGLSDAVFFCEDCRYQPGIPSFDISGTSTNTVWDPNISKQLLWYRYWYSEISIFWHISSSTCINVAWSPCKQPTRQKACVFLVVKHNCLMLTVDKLWQDEVLCVLPENNAGTRTAKVVAAV